jgi:hypothetical protein
MDEVDPMAMAIDQAAEHLQSALHAVSEAAVDPRTLYARTSDLVSVFGRAQEVALALSDQIDKARETHELGSDDDTSAEEHVESAARALTRAAAEPDDARRLADRAWSALSHLKLDGP